MPMGITTHSYKPQGVLTAVSFTSSGCMRVWKKLFVMSRDAKYLPVPQSERISEMRGRGKESVIVFVLSCQ